jgi:hypothetical protein
MGGTGGTSPEKGMGLKYTAASSVKLIPILSLGSLGLRPPFGIRMPSDAGTVKE